MASRSDEDLCILHSEKLRLFCLDHQQPVCLVCRDSKKHTDHRFRPIDEAAQEHKEELQKSLQPLKEKLKVFKEVKDQFDQTSEHMLVQVRDTERQIREQFRKLRQFVQEEEEARLAALRAEKVRKSQMMKEKMEALSRDIAALSHTVRDTEYKLRAEDISFLNNYKAAVERVQQCPLLEPPQLHSGALIDQATFHISNKMKNMVPYTPVILDPNTAHPDLIVSEDLTSVRQARQRQQLPDNPERNKYPLTVLGSEGFDSGTHSWVVEVGDSKSWGVGVVTRSFHRETFPHLTLHEKIFKILSGATKCSGLWILEFNNKKYLELSDTSGLSTVLDVKRKLQRVRVDLDYSGGKLFFSDPDTNTHISTVTHTFTERIFPYFNTKDKLKILPVRSV